MRRALSFTLLLALSVSGCGGGSVGLPQGGTNGTIGGVVRVNGDFQVPAGKSIMVSSNLTVIASGSVTVAGNLVVPPGTRIVMFAGNTLTISGAIVSTNPQQTTTQSSVRHATDTPVPPVTHVFSAPNITLQPPPSGGTASVNPGDNISISTSAANGIITLGGVITLPPGTSGTDPNAAPGTPGGAMAGGNIEVGTAQAINDVNAAATAAGTPANAVAPSLVNLIPPAGFTNVFLQAGTGGNGAPDVNGKIQGLAVIMHSGSGARGGNLDLAGASVVFNGAVGFEPTLLGGFGGNGGAIGTDGKVVFSDAVDGLTPGAPGLSIDATSGDGADGGDVVLTGNGSANIATTRGPHGYGGSLSNARAGNGGPGGDGGSTTFLLGKPGVDGKGTMSFPGGRVRPNVSLNGGGSGGTATSGSYAGGNGGPVSLLSAAGGPMLNTTFVGLTNYTNGAIGYNGCTTTPAVAGTKGGNGGSLTVAGVAYTTTSSMNAAAGGAGAPSGAPGGTGGSDDKGLKVGKDGDKGASCTGAVTPSPSPSPTPTPAPSAAPTATPSPTPTPTPTPGGQFGAVILQPSTLAFNFPGDTRTVTASQSGNTTNTFSASAITCPNNHGSGSITQLTFNTFSVMAVTTSSGGTCSGTITGLGGISATLQMTF